jgi:oligosaccharide repeat unit polymerase
MIRYIANPLLLFLLVWGCAVGLYLAGVHAGMFPSPGLPAIGAVGLNIAAFCLGYLTWALFRSRGPAPAEADLAQVRPLNPDRVRRALRFTGLMGLIALSLGFYRIAVIAAHSDASFFTLLMDPRLLRMKLVTFIAANVLQTSGVVMLMSVTSSLFSIGFILLGVFLHVGRTRTRYFYLGGFLLISLAIAVTNLSRYEATVNILYLVFSYCTVRCFDQRDAVKRDVPGLLIPLAAVVVLFFVIDLLLQKSAEYGRADRLAGFLYHLYWYVASPLAAFNEFLNSFDGRHHLGEYMFFPLYKWLCRFGLVPESNLSVYGEFVLVPYAANVYTYLRNFYEDFGMLGVAAAPYVLGWAVCALKVQAGRYFPLLNLYVVLLVFILFSFYNYFLFSNQVYLQVLFGFVFFRYALPSSEQSDAAVQTGRSTVAAVG